MDNSNLKTESIDGVILRLLKIEPGTELDYQTYFDKLKTKLVLVNAVKQILPAEENQLLRDELTRVKKIKDKGLRFKVKKVKVSNNVPPPSPSSSKESEKSQSPISPGAIVKYKPGALVLVPKEETKEEPKEEKKESPFTNIKKVLDSILKIFSSKFKFEQKQADQDRKDQETEKRSKRESGLEGFAKGVGVIVSTAKQILSPFDDIIERIKRFLFFVLLGRGFTAFMKWIKDKENRKKFDSLVEFLSKHWPALAGLYVLFGTSFGKLVRGLLKGSIRLVFALGKGIFNLAAFIRKNKKLSFLALATLPLVTGKLKEMLSGNGDSKQSKEIDVLSDKNPDLEDTKKTIDKLQSSQSTASPSTNTPSSTKGSSPAPAIPKKNVGGIISSPSSTKGSSPAPAIPKKNVGGIIPSFKLGGLKQVNPFNSDMNYQSGIPITGAGPDNTLIAAKTGEAVLTEKDQEDLSKTYVNKNTGQALNIPRYLSGRKSNYVSMNNIKPVSGSMGRFAGGGIIERFNSGGLVNTYNPSVNVNNGDSNFSVSPEVNINSNTLSKMQGGGSSLSVSPSISMGSNITNRMQGGGSSLSVSPSISMGSNITNRMQGGGSVNSVSSNITNRMQGGGSVNSISSNFIGGMQSGNTRTMRTGGSVGTSAGKGTNIGTNIGTRGKKPSYGANLKYKSPIPEYPNYQTPTDEYGKFFAKIYAMARKAGDPFPEVVAAQAVEESNFGKSKIAKEANNLFGQDAPPNASPERRYEYFDPVEQRNHVAYKFPSIEESVKYRVKTWKRFYGNTKIPAQAIRNIAVAGYNPHAKYPGTIISRMKEYGVDPFVPSPVIIVVNPTQKKSWWDNLNPLNWFDNSKIKGKRAGGFVGLIDDSSGIDIPGQTADRRLISIGGKPIAGQPGEYVLPKSTVNALGLPLIERLVAMTDKNSDAFLKRSSLNIPEITPLRSGKNDFINLPPIEMPSSSGPLRARTSGDAVLSSTPTFSAVSPMSDREHNAKMYYGIA